MIQSFLKKIKKNIASGISFCKKTLFSLYGICFLTLFFTTSTIAVTSIFIFSEVLKTLEGEKYLSSIESRTNELISEAKLYNTKLDRMYRDIDYKFYTKILTSLRNLDTSPNKRNLNNLKKISNKNSVEISLINYSNTKIELSSSSSLIGVDLGKKHPNLKSDFATLQPGKISFRFAWNPFTKGIVLFSKTLTSDKTHIWEISKTVDKTHNIIRTIKNLKFSGYNDDPFIVKVGAYSENRLTNHNISKVKLPSSLETISFNTRCSSHLRCLTWKKIEAPSSLKDSQFIRYLGLEYDGKNIFKYKEIILNKLYDIIVFSLIFSLLLSFILSKLLVRSIYKILNAVKSLSEDFEKKVKAPKVWNYELNELSLIINKLIKRFFEKERSRKNLQKISLLQKTKKEESSRVTYMIQLANY